MDDYDYDYDIDELDVDDAFDEDYDDDEMSFDAVTDDYDDDFDDDDDDDIDSVLDGLMAEDSADAGEAYEDFFGRRRRKRKARRRKLARARAQAKRKAKARAAAAKAQRNRSSALARQVSKNRKSIAAVDRRLSTTIPQVKANRAATKRNSRVNTLQSRQIARNRKTLKIDGAIDFARSVGLSADPNGAIGVEIDVPSFVQGLVKNDVLGKGKGFLSSPTGLAALAFIGANYQPILNAIGNTGRP